MKISKALNVLKQQLDEISKLRTLPPERQQYEVWRGKVCNILELTFGKESREYDNFSRAVCVDYPTYTDEEKRKKYNKEIDAYEIALKSAIHKCELLKAEEKPLEALRPHDERQSKQYLEKEIRKHLQGTPPEVAPHIIRVAREFKFQDFSYDAEEEPITSDKFSKYISIHRVTGWLDPNEFLIKGDQGLPHEVLPHLIGGIVLQPLPNNKTLFIAKYASLSFDSNGTYFDSFLERLSLEFKNLGIEETTVKKMWRWFKEIIGIVKAVKP